MVEYEPENQREISPEIANVLLVASEEAEPISKQARLHDNGEYMDGQTLVSLAVVRELLRRRIKELTPDAINLLVTEEEVRKALKYLMRNSVLAGHDAVINGQDLILDAIARSVDFNSLYPFVKLDLTETAGLNNEDEDENVAALSKFLQNHKSKLHTGNIDNEKEQQVMQQIEKALKTLSYREREIVKMRYGLRDGNIYTLKEIASVFKLTGERIRQIEAKALKKLSHRARTAMLPIQG